jgi:hypothetical protein
MIYLQEMTAIHYTISSCSFYTIDDASKLPTLAPASSLTLHAVHLGRVDALLSI